MTRLVLAFAALVLLVTAADAAPPALPKYPTASGSGYRPHYPPASPANPYTIKELKPAPQPKVEPPAPGPVRSSSVSSENATTSPSRGM